MNFGPVTPDFTRVVGVHPLVDQHWGQFSYVHLAAPLRRSVLSFAGRSIRNFVSPFREGASLLSCAGYTLGAVTPV